MLIGNPEVFAIEYEIVMWAGQPWAFGRFQFWCNHRSIGDWDDDSVDVKACARHFRAFVNYPVNRFEPDLVGKSKDDIFPFLYEPVMNRRPSVIEPFPSVYPRFFITQLGMSAFVELAAMLLIEEPDRQRLIWRALADPTIHEAILPPGEMQRVGAEFCKQFQAHEIERWGQAIL